MASSYEIGNEGMDGWLPPSRRVAFLYAGSPGVLGSPGYFDNCVAGQLNVV